MAIPLFHTAAASAKSIWQRFTTSTVAEKSQILPYIDGLRGIAILMVVTYHLAQQLFVPFKYSTSAVWANVGDRGVQLFFILSAFTLFASSERRFRTDRKPVLSFYIRRGFRILPFWWLINLYWAVVNQADFTAIAASSTFVFGFLRFIPGYELVPGGWSLFVEETFYIFLPLIFGYIRNLYRALGLAAILWFISDLWWHHATKVAILNHDNVIFFAPFAQWFAFGLGIALYFVVAHQWVKKTLLENHHAYLLLDGLALLALWHWLPGEYRLGSLAFFVLIFASIPAKSVFGRITRLGLLRRFGRYSYSLYLLHFAFLTLLSPLRDWLWQALNVVSAPAEVKLAVYLPVFCAILLASGFLSFNLIEKPCINLGRKLNAKINRGKPKPATEAELTAL